MKRLLFAVVAAGMALVAEAGAVELVAPGDGALLEGGREATLVWSAGSLPEHVEEWEAFLSLDGGKYYAVRITPHLDAATRSFRWRVPNVAASDARILLRIGDERDERAIEFPQHFRIVAGAASIDPTVPKSTVTEASGEPALPSAPPVVEWVSGDRSGAGLVTHRHRDRYGFDRQSVFSQSGVVSAAQLSSRIALHRPAQSHHEIAAARALLRINPPLTPRPLFLLITRLNV